ncbi:MAG: hypothetical protein OEY10_00085 [Nitrosopumilus sp.]|nr:hypothetical protein [Nitrosopumilus sp.]
MKTITQKFAVGDTFYVFYPETGNYRAYTVGRISIQADSYSEQEVLRYHPKEDHSAKFTADKALTELEVLRLCHEYHFQKMTGIEDRIDTLMSESGEDE